MLKRLKTLISDRKDLISESTDRIDPIHVAASALLVEAAFSDGDFGAEERDKIRDLLREYFDYSNQEVEELLVEAEKAVKETAQLYGFTRAVKDNFDQNERINIIEMLWEVVFADGKVDSYEANLVQRVAGLIFVSDKERGFAKRRAMEKLGIAN